MARGSRNPPACWQPPRSSSASSSSGALGGGPLVPEKGKIVESTRALGKRKIVKGRAVGKGETLTSPDVGKGKSVKSRRPVDSDEDERPYERIKKRPDQRRRYYHPDEYGYDDLSGEELEPDFYDKYFPFVRQGRITFKEYQDRIFKSKTYKRSCRQAYLSQGFDVEDLPPPSEIPNIIPWSFIKDGSHNFLNQVFGLAELALRRYNGRFRRSYKVVDVVKWNKERVGVNVAYYITFNVKKEGKNCGSPKIFQAKVGVLCGTKKPLVELCRPRPAKKAS